MKRLITTDDFIDTYSKIKQRGNYFFFSKFTFNSQKRTKSAFDKTAHISSNWWIVPKIRKRWNTLTSGNPEKNYENYLIENYLQNKSNLKLLSLGAGSCSHEIELAKNTTIFEEIVCLDIADNLLEQASKKAQKKNLTNLKFITQSIYDFKFNENDFDIVLFHSSLHHFKDVEQLLQTKITKTLKPSGLLIINEFVGANRLQFPKNQIKAVNNALQVIPKKYKIRFKNKWIKNKFSGPGYIRMVMADPSECVDSKNIIPAIHKHFKILDEKPLGGNILMNALRDIAHHFIETNPEKEEILNKLFMLEDEYLKNNSSDFVFGIYQNIKTN